MAAPTMSHIICSMALVALIFVLPSFYSIVVDNVEADVITKELQEITDYTSNTIENLYFLANSTNSQEVFLEKELLYLPAVVEESVYILNVTEVEGKVTTVTAFLKTDPTVSVTSWIIPGLKLAEKNAVIESSEKSVIAGCEKNASGIYVWIRYD
ncbi:MAG: hypothetical protein FK734_00585 [Asgard group archaeon]|nr:hypothetical protein [Asgard group archaeon]